MIQHDYQLTSLDIYPDMAKDLWIFLWNFITLAEDLSYLIEEYWGTTMYEGRHLFIKLAWEAATVLKYTEVHY